MTWATGSSRAPCSCELESEDSDLAVRQAEHQLMAELAKLGLKELPPGDFDVSTVPAVIQAEVMLNKAKQNLARERSLMQRNAGTMQDFQNAENDVRGYEAALANAILTARSTLVGAQAMKVMLAVSALSPVRDGDPRPGPLGACPKGSPAGSPTRSPSGRSPRGRCSSRATRSPSW